MWEGCQGACLVPFAVWADVRAGVKSQSCMAAEGSGAKVLGSQRPDVSHVVWSLFEGHLSPEGCPDRWETETLYWRLGKPTGLLHSTPTPRLTKKTEIELSNVTNKNSIGICISGKWNRYISIPSHATFEICRKSVLLMWASNSSGHFCFVGVHLGLGGVTGFWVTLLILWNWGTNLGCCCKASNLPLAVSLKSLSYSAL